MYEHGHRHKTDVFCTTELIKLLTLCRHMGKIDHWAKKSDTVSPVLRAVIEKNCQQVQLLPFPWMQAMPSFEPCGAHGKTVQT